MKNGQQVKCDFCGNKFVVDREDKRKERSKYKKFCSPKCYFESKKSGACVDCGSLDIVIHNHIAYPKKICGGCLENRKLKRRKKRVNDWRDEYKNLKKAKCDLCGRETNYIENRVKRLMKPAVVLCKKCKSSDLIRKRFRFCNWCGRIFFDWSKHRITLFCSNYCRMEHRDINAKRYGRKHGICQDCGRVIGIIKNHASTGYVCKECMYVRKRGYKDKIIFGGSNANALRKIRLIEASGSAFEQLTEGEGLKWQSKKRLDWRKVVKLLKESVK